MPALKANLVKRVDRLPKPSKTAEALQPLFEAISNSIHATQDRFKDKVSHSGKIEVIVESNQKKDGPIITVSDNGEGLNDRNFDAFTTTDTDNKINRGGKGVGRLLWLDCFSSIRVDSTYKLADNPKRIAFNFILSRDDQIQHFSDDMQPKPDTGTEVIFTGLRNNGYKAHFPSRGAYIFNHFASHFLPTLIGENAPAIFVTCGDDTRKYPEELSKIILRREDVNDIPSLRFGNLSLKMMECDKVASSDLSGHHFVHFIAHDRTVKSQKIDAKLGFKYFGPSVDRVFHACLFGDYFNKHVNQERTDFTFPDVEIENIISDVCMEHINRFLEAPLVSQKHEQGAIINKIVDTYPSVAFGSVDELQKHLPAGEMKDDAIYMHLSRQRFRRDQKQGEKIRDALAKLKAGDVKPEDFTTMIKEATAAIEKEEQKSLAEYIVRRKVVLEFLTLLIQKTKDETPDSAYQREDVLHTMICPMRINALSGGSKRISAASSHELWILDERLTFAQYFSSDIPFNDLAKQFASDERPDVLIYDRVHGLRTSDNTSKVLLIEFKRPGRKNYSLDENPQLQVERYIRKLLSGTEFDVNGRPIRLKPDTVFYCYIVADCVGPMAEWTFGWSKTADGRGKIYQPNNNYTGSIELIEWDALLDDARERNQAFFDYAGISGRSVFSRD